MNVRLTIHICVRAYIVRLERVHKYDCVCARGLNSLSVSCGGSSNSIAVGSDLSLIQFEVVGVVTFALVV